MRRGKREQIVSYLRTQNPVSASEQIEGFSLIELSIAVGIILILAAIAIPNLLRARISANRAGVRRFLSPHDQLGDDYLHDQLSDDRVCDHLERARFYALPSRRKYSVPGRWSSCRGHKEWVQIRRHRIGDSGH